METTLQASPASSTAARLRTPFVGLLAGLLAGLLNAILARVLMRIVALVVSGQGSFSVGGTAAIFGFAMLLGPLLGIVYRAVWRFLPGPTLVKGLVYGIALVIVFQIPVLYIVPDFRQELMIAGPVGFGVFGLINFAFVLTLARLTAWLEDAWPRDGSRRAAVMVGTVALGLLALGGLGVLVYELGGRLVGLVE